MCRQVGFRGAGLPAVAESRVEVASRVEGTPEGGFPEGDLFRPGKPSRTVWCVWLFACE